MGCCLNKQQREIKYNCNTKLKHTYHPFSIKPFNDRRIFLKEYDNINTNIPYIFNDIIDPKHTKYINIFNNKSDIFWGLGIENESYLMFSSKSTTPFKKLKYKRERYSVDYYNNFNKNILYPILQSVPSTITYPVYINSHTFNHTDIHHHHKTIYDSNSTPNTLFCESLHDILLRESIFYSTSYDYNIAYDGDSIEFITQQFYNTNVDTCINELIHLKTKYIDELNPFFTKWGMDCIQFPDHNYGFVTFQTTNCKQLSLCNNGTYHINITLPTLLKDGLIIDKPTFIFTHLQYITFIQIIEPIFIACYGTPDILSTIDSSYSIGSLRSTLSRYISLQTFSTESPINGKLLLKDVPKDGWYPFVDSPYLFNKQIGYDINFNKYKNHGIEIRFIDWFPEIYLKDVINFFILLAQHSLSFKNTIFHKSAYINIIRSCIQKGHTYTLSIIECNQILNDLQLPSISITKSAYHLLQYISDILYGFYHNSLLIHRMSPKMKQPILVNYNSIVYNIYSKY